LCLAARKKHITRACAPWAETPVGRVSERKKETGGGGGVKEAFN